MLPAVFFYSDKASRAMLQVAQNLPANIDVYLVGGVLRNALVKKYHGETWLQRDYDQIVTKGSEEYFQFLYGQGFSDGFLDRPNHKVVAKQVVENGREISYEDNLVFDIHMEDGTTPIDNLTKNTGLLINGFALSLRDVFDPEWEDKLIQLPGALDCIKNKQIRVNPAGYASDANYFFACIRFMGKGFAAPPKEEIGLLLAELPKLEHDRYQKNLPKLVDYVGGEENARDLITQAIGDEIDIFDEDSAKATIAARYQ